MKMVAALLAWLGMTGWAAARENPYDVLGKALMPIANVFAGDGNDASTGKNAGGHALVLDAHLLPGTTEEEGKSGGGTAGGSANLPIGPQEMPIARLALPGAHLTVMPPNALLVQAPIAGQMLTVCRDGDALWATPGSKIQPLLDQLTAGAAAGKKKKKRMQEGQRVLGPLVLPVPRKELVFLPVLFQVADAGDGTIGGKPCTVLDVQLMPQLEKSLHAQGWTARVWIGADYGIAQIALTGPDWSGTVAIDRLAFPAELPAGTFQPQGTDVLRLTGEEFLGIMGRVGRE